MVQHGCILHGLDDHHYKYCIPDTDSAAAIGASGSKPETK